MKLKQVILACGCCDPLTRQLLVLVDCLLAMMMQHKAPILADRICYFTFIFYIPPGCFAPASLSSFSVGFAL